MWRVLRSVNELVKLVGIFDYIEYRYIVQNFVFEVVEQKDIDKGRHRSMNNKKKRRVKKRQMSVAEVGDIELEKLIPFIAKIQKEGGFSLTDAYLVKTAIDYLSMKDDELASKLVFSNTNGDSVSPQVAASQIILSAIMKGQERGIFTLSEAHDLALYLRLVK